MQFFSYAHPKHFVKNSYITFSTGQMILTNEDMINDLVIDMEEDIKHAWDKYLS